LPGAGSVAFPPSPASWPGQPGRRPLPYVTPSFPAPSGALSAAPGPFASFFRTSGPPVAPWSRGARRSAVPGRGSTSGVRLRWRAHKLRAARRWASFTGPLPGRLSYDCSCSVLPCSWSSTGTAVCASPRE